MAHMIIPMSIFSIFDGMSLGGAIYLLIVAFPIWAGILVLLFKLFSFLYEIISIWLRCLFDFKGRKRRRLIKEIEEFTKGKYEKALRAFCKDRYGKEGYYSHHDLDNSQLKELLNIPEDEWKLCEEKEVRKEAQIKERYQRIEQRYPNGLKLYKERNVNANSIHSIISVPEKIFDDLEKSSNYYRGKVRLMHDIWLRSVQDHTTAQKYMKCQYSSYEYLDTNEYGESCSFRLNFAHSYLYGYCDADDLEYEYLPGFKDAEQFADDCLSCKESINDDASNSIIGFIGEIKPEFVCLSCPEDRNVEIRREDYHFRSIKEQLVGKGINVFSRRSSLPSSRGDCAPIVILELVSTPTSIKDNLDWVFKDRDILSARIVYVSVFIQFSRREACTLIDINKWEKQHLKEAEELEKVRIKEELEKKFKEELDARVEQEYERRKNVLTVIDEAEYSRLECLTKVLKPDARAMLQYLEANGIKYFYHFTDRSNIDSIKKYGGLFSWHYCEEKGIVISKPGGDSLSRSLDSGNGLEDYVRCSFCTDLPMRHTLAQKGYNLVLLRIKADVALIEGTLFSDMNATDNEHHHGGTLDDLKMVNLTAVREPYVSRENWSFKFHQAEVLVKTFIPLRYIQFPDYIGRYK